MRLREASKKFVGGEDIGMDWSADLGPLVGVKRGFGTGKDVKEMGRVVDVSEEDGLLTIRKSACQYLL
jgi:hypothetical protein